VEGMMNFFRDVTYQEDYDIAMQIQKGLETGAHDNLTFGRNERGNQYFHEWLNWYLQDDPTLPEPHPMTLQENKSRYSPEFDVAVRGDTITADRYISPEWMKKEHANLWPKVWHLGGLLAELEEEGDFVRHNFGKESVIMVRQGDDTIRAFYNACPHRGNRLVLGDAGHMPRITCGYHGWQFTPDGVLAKVQDPDDFPDGNPCGK
ncbi:hypothetical protein KXV85_001745, partial [Aspergillus fumigatus]